MGSLTAAQDGRPAEAVALGVAALASWDRLRHTRELAVLMGYLGAMHYWVGDSRAGVERARLGYELNKESQSIEGSLVGEADLGLALTGVGSYEEPPSPGLGQPVPTSE